jgi:hypothetical protein
MNQCRILIINQKLVKGNFVFWNEARYSVYAVIYLRNININIFNSIERSLTSSGNAEVIPKTDVIKIFF